MFAATVIFLKTLTTLPAICHHAIKGAGATITIAGGINTAVTDSDGDRTRRQRFARRVQNSPPSTATA
jgi:hypothetical protein